jgi:crotonobetaine/carnitine-CoA ligase
LSAAAIPQTGDAPSQTGIFRVLPWAQAPQPVENGGSMITDPRIPAPDICVLRPLLDRRAAEHPDRLYAIFPDGSQWSYGELHKRVRQTACALQDLGVNQGDNVLVWLPNGPDILRIWFAINYIGAVYVPINTAYRGRLLEHVVENSDAKLAIVHAGLAERLNEVKTAKLEQIAVLSGTVRPIGSLKMLDGAILSQGDGDVLPLARDIQPWDLQCIVYTSGTTGPSKGVMNSYLQLYSTGEPIDCLDETDRYMVNLPLFHVGGTLPCYAMLARGGSIALIEAFDTESFWSTVKRTGTTYVILLGVMAGFLMKRPDKGDEKDTTLRHVHCVPFDEDSIAFGKRFGIDVYTLFNMTEVSCPLVSELNPSVPGTCGKPRPGIEARVVDENDCEVGPNQVGELIVRADRPWSMNSGYNKNPEATAKAWRNGWFHTGDAFRVDEEGYFFFVDRMKDAIRRRGENISSFEVEAEIIAHPSVREAAAVAVKSEIAEDELLVAVSLAEGATLDPVELIEFLRPRMAHFMIPRYVRVLADLPKTPTQKVQKHVIRTEGVTTDTWDRDKAGIKVRREKLAG